MGWEGLEWGGDEGGNSEGVTTVELPATHILHYKDRGQQRGVQFKQYWQMQAKSLTPQQQKHLLGLLGQFVSPFKILHMLDPIQADHFTKRNGHSCQHQGNKHNHEHAHQHKHGHASINIPEEELTPNQKILFELTSTYQLKSTMEEILAYAGQRFKSIVQNGKKDGLAINDQVQKYLLDQVMAETANQTIYKALTQRIHSQSKLMHQQIGLWATHTSWQQQHPQWQLNRLQGKTLAGLMKQGWGIQEYFYPKGQGLASELHLLLKDGQFEDSSWLAQSHIRSKALHDPYKLSEARDSQNNLSFPGLGQAVVLMSSLPFELNVKANIFCTVSPNLHCQYATEAFSKNQSSPLSFSATLVINQQAQFKYSQRNHILKAGTLVLIDCKKCKDFQLSSGKGGVFFMRSFIGTASKQ